MKDIIKKSLLDKLIDSFHYYDLFSPRLKVKNLTPEEVNIPINEMPENVLESEIEQILLDTGEKVAEADIEKFYE